MRQSPALRGGVEVAIIHQRFDLELGRSRRRTHQVVAHKRGVRALLHPHALLDQRIGAGKRPHRSRAGQMKALDQPEAVGTDRAVGPAIRAERVVAAVVAQRSRRIWRPAASGPPAAAARQPASRGSGASARRPRCPRRIRPGRWSPAIRARRRPRASRTPPSQNPPPGARSRLTSCRTRGSPRRESRGACSEHKKQNHLSDLRRLGPERGIRRRHGAAIGGRIEDAGHHGIDVDGVRLHFFGQRIEKSQRAGLGSRVERGARPSVRSRRARRRSRSSRDSAESWRAAPARASANPDARLSAIMRS